MIFQRASDGFKSLECSVDSKDILDNGGYLILRRRIQEGDNVICELFVERQDSMLQEVDVHSRNDWTFLGLAIRGVELTFLPGTKKACVARQSQHTPPSFNLWS